MNKVILLNSDGSYVTKNENKIRYSDIKHSEYLLIPSDATDNPEFRNYIMVNSSEYLLFDTAIIEYQMGVFYYDEDDTSNTSNFAPINPIHMEVNTISDLFRCINCVDKFNVVNNITRDINNYDNSEVGILYLSVRLFQNSKEIYNRYYEKKGTSSVPFDSYKVIKKFDDIYINGVCSNVFNKDEYLLISSSGKNKTWNITSEVDDSLLIGIPLLQSNTITFVTNNEFNAFNKYTSYDYRFYVYYTKLSDINDLNKSILSGDSVDDISTKIENFLDVYISIDNGYIFSRKTKNFLIDFLSHSKFIINTINLIYSELYPYVSPLFNKEGESEVFQFDSVMCIKIYKQAKESYKNIAMNNSTLITFSDIISSM